VITANILEHRECQMWNRCRVCRIRGAADTRESHQDTPPSMAPPGEKASEYPITTHCTDTMPSGTSDIIMLFSVFFPRTSPP